MVLGLRLRGRRVGMVVQRSEAILARTKMPHKSIEARDVILDSTDGFLGWRE
jgi:hypothetical protein